MKFCFASLRYLWAQEEGPNVKNTAEWQVCWQIPHPANLKKIIPPTDGMCLNALPAGVFVTEYQQSELGRPHRILPRRKAAMTQMHFPIQKTQGWWIPCLHSWLLLALHISLGALSSPFKKKGGGALRKSDYNFGSKKLSIYIST